MCVCVCVCVCICACVYVCVPESVYPRERYALIITPLLVHAQRRLLERITSFGGPAVPQPHHIKTQKATSKQVAQTSTCVDCRDLLWGQVKMCVRHPHFRICGFFAATPIFEALLLLILSFTGNHLLVTCIMRS